MMEIVIKKVPITKRIIEQMPHATLEVLQNGDVLGMVVNVKKDSYKTMVLACKDEFYWHNMQWNKDERILWRKIGGWISQIKFETEEKCNEYWEVYSKAISIAENKHVYI